MAAPLRPEPALTHGRENWIYVPAGGLADPAAPTDIELSAASVLDFTNMAFAEGTTPVTQTTERIASVPRIGDTKSYERKGRTALAGGTLSFALRPQDAAGEDGKKAWETFKGGPDGGYLVNRLDVPKDTAPTAGQFVSVYPADISDVLVTKVGEGAAGEVAGTGEYFIRDAIHQLVAVVAGV